MPFVKTMNLELVVLIVIQDLCRVGETGDEFVTLVVKNVLGKIFVLEVSHSACRPCAIPAGFLQKPCPTPISQRG